MATGIIGKDVLEVMLPLEERANFGHSEVGKNGGSSGNCWVHSDLCLLPPNIGEGVVPKSSG